jgi:hypothetical protein
VRNGRTYTITEVISAVNYPDYSVPEEERQPCWYIESSLKEASGGIIPYSYWKQDEDGGVLLPPLHDPYSCPVCNGNDIDTPSPYIFEHDNGVGYLNMACCDCKSMWALLWNFDKIVGVQKG